jgi:hypothetical protein
MQLKHEEAVASRNVGFAVAWALPQEVFTMQIKRFLIPAVAALGLTLCALPSIANAGAGTSGVNDLASQGKSNVTLVRGFGGGGFRGGGFRGGGFRGAGFGGARFAGVGVGRGFYGGGWGRGWGGGWGWPVGAGLLGVGVGLGYPGWGYGWGTGYPAYGYGGGCGW